MVLWVVLAESGNHCNRQHREDFQHVYRNFVFALGNEKASEALDLS